MTEWQLVVIQAINGNNDYIIIDLIWILPEQTYFCNNQYFSFNLKLKVILFHHE